MRLWVEKGREAAFREVVQEDPEWIGVYMEVSRKFRTDPAFRARHQSRTDGELAPLLIEHVRAEQEEGTLRADSAAEHIADFIGLVANGVAVQLGSAEPIRSVDVLVELVRAAVTNPAPSRRPRRTPP